MRNEYLSVRIYDLIASSNYKINCHYFYKNLCKETLPITSQGAIMYATMKESMTHSEYYCSICSSKAMRCKKHVNKLVSSIAMLRLSLESTSSKAERLLRSRVFGLQIPCEISDWRIKSKLISTVYC